MKYFSMNIYMTMNGNDEVENMCSNNSRVDGPIPIPKIMEPLPSAW